MSEGPTPKKSQFFRCPQELFKVQFVHPSRVHKSPQEAQREAKKDRNCVCRLFFERKKEKIMITIRAAPRPNSSGTLKKSFFSFARARK